MSTSASWSTQHLVEFLAAVSSFPDESSALHGGLERIAEAMDAEIIAVTASGAVLDQIGFPRGVSDFEQIHAAARATRGRFVFAAVGACETISVPLNDPNGPRLVIARVGDEGFDGEEESLARGMGRILGLSLHSHRVIDTERVMRELSQRQAQEHARLLWSLQERQALLERLSRIQRSISRRADLSEVLNAIVDGAQELIGDEVAAVRLIDPKDPQTMEMVAHRGVREDIARAIRRLPVTQGAGGRAVSEDQLIVIESYDRSADALRPFAEDHLQAAMAAPVREGGRPVGSLVVATYQPGRTYSQSERQVLLAFAEHASIALTDARTVEMQLHQAFHDPLTDMPNRALFLNRLESALHLAGRRSPRLAMLFVDLDRFKLVNDTLGHGAGDELLIDVADRIRACLRDEDMGARLGGDEFAILLHDVEDQTQVMAVADRIMDAMRASYVAGGREVFITASIGVAIATAGEDAGTLLRNADVAMYRAKLSGKGQIALFEPRMHAALLEKLHLEADLQRAIEYREFVIHYQPIVNLVSGEISSFEALVRWHHPTRGLLSSAEFVPVAEEAGLIVPIGGWVVRAACEALAEWRRTTGNENLTMSVNLSPRQFQQATLVEQIATALRLAGLDPSSLVLEITETVVMQDTESTVAKLRELKNLGVRIAIDDFGTGYSSLSYLRRFPVDILKIDKTFIDGVTAGPDESALARAIVKLGRTLDLHTVAEGIESEDQAEALRALRCDYGQGYLFSPPMADEQVRAMLARTKGRKLLRSVG